MRYLITAAIICSTGLTFGQGNCSATEHRQFDFWLGEWEVFSNGQYVGVNTIELAQDSCVLVENWVGNGSQITGTSYNYYDAADSTWNQTWVDNQGGNLVLKGKWNGEAMVMKSMGDPTGNVHQMSWTPNSDGTVQQVWTVTPTEGDTITIFDGFYVRPQR